MVEKEKKVKQHYLKIDFQSHCFPGELFLRMNKYFPEKWIIQKSAEGRDCVYLLGTPLPAWDYNHRIETMDEDGVDIEILSNPLMYEDIDEHFPEICRITNDAFADICRQNPKRFKAFANLPFNDMPEALKEMNRVLALPGFVGVLIGSNVGGKYLNTPDFLPFWDEVNRRRVPVYMHPRECPGYQDDDMVPLLAFPFDTTLSATKLLYSGLFERCPDLILILAHMGGALPYLARRIDLGYDVPAFDDKYHKIPRRPSEYMPKLYLDTALSYHKPSFECARGLVSIDHLVYASDHFMEGSKYMKWTNEFLESLDISESDLEKIYSGNALRILKM
jgi:aminocarboxymuconate-semialdehyde decarboxylase